ncbi:MAG: ABC transporter ATP-binding protein, partial [Chloroflexi bacterium]|nr:ABC transporter ATP-binding protein [Chloroflexota bacterium]
ITVNGRDVLSMDGEQLRQVRGREVSMVFQDPMSGLNPVIPIGSQVAELLQAHLPMSKQEAQKRTRGVLAQVGLPNPDKIAESYPFQLSGGMCQRVMIGIATALNPAVLIADEPTSALDVTVQAQILQQLRVMRQQNGTSALLITHDMGVVAQMCDEVAVMYAGTPMTANCR